MIPRPAAVASLLSVVLLGASGAARAQQGGLGCAVGAATDYTWKKFALFQSQPLFSVPSIELTLEKRRLKEAYCLRYTRCLFSDEAGFQGTFASCVQEKD